MFIVTVLAVRALVSRLVALPAGLVPRIAAYGIGTLAAFWTVERIAGFF
jgi:hypothetical protein